jgi:hypothetical protein
MPTLPPNFIQKRVDVIIQDLDFFFGSQSNNMSNLSERRRFFLKKMLN